MKFKVVPIASRFWKHVKKTKTCWIWTASKFKTGYGQIRAIEGSPQRNVKAHRLSWELHNGPIPNGMFICHSCDNPACVRPDHLWLGNNQTNMADRQKKGRTAKGENSGHVLTEKQVKEMRKRYPKESQRGLAKIFGVSSETARKAILGMTWKHI